MSPASAWAASCRTTLTLALTPALTLALTLTLTLTLILPLTPNPNLQDDASLSLHMQLMHAPRGVGSLQNAATLHRPWFDLVSRAFSK